MHRFRWRTLAPALIASRALQPAVVLLAFEAEFVHELGVRFEAVLQLDGERLLLAVKSDPVTVSMPDS
jgi:hypothetical protein